MKIKGSGCCGLTGSGTWTRTTASEAAGAETFDESSTSIWVAVAFDLVSVIEES